MKRQVTEPNWVAVEQFCQILDVIEELVQLKGTGWATVPDIRTTPDVPVDLKKVFGRRG